MVTICHNLCTALKGPSKTKPFTIVIGRVVPLALLDLGRNRTASVSQPNLWYLWRSALYFFFYSLCWKFLPAKHLYNIRTYRNYRIYKFYNQNHNNHTNLIYLIYLILVGWQVWKCRPHLGRCRGASQAVACSGHMSHITQGLQGSKVWCTSRTSTNADKTGKSE